MERAVWIALLRATILESVPVWLEHSGMEDPASATLVPGIISVEIFPLYAPNAQSIQYPSPNLLRVLHALRALPGKTIPALNALVIKWETELLAEHVQQDQCHSTPM